MINRTSNFFIIGLVYGVILNMCNETNFDIFCDDYLEKNVVPEYIAFYISQLFYTNSIENNTFSRAF